ncbi:MAG: hypothetical protein AB7O97_02605 [Planctomycetota bacterium]
MQSYPASGTPDGGAAAAPAAAAALRRGPSRIEEFGAAVAAGIIAYLLSCLVEPALTEPCGFGEFWQSMSEQPFAFVGQLPHRILSPLLAHWLGLDGLRFTDFTRLTGVLMLSLCYAVARRRGARAVDAWLITLAIAFTGAIQIYKRGMVGYCDNLSYSLFLIGYLVARHGWAFWTVFFLNLLNHDLAAFFLPWMLFVRRQAAPQSKLRWDVVAIVAVVALYWGYRQYVKAHAPNWEYNEQYFFDNMFLPISFLWLWFLASVHALLQFGPLLVIVLWHAWWPRPPRDRVHTLLVLVGIGSIFGFAYDVMRHTNMLFVPLLLASTRFLVDARSRVVFMLLIALKIWMYREFLWQEPGDPSNGWLFEWFTGVMTMDCGGHVIILPEYRFDVAGHWELLKCALPRIWPVLFNFAWEILGIVALSRWLIRRNIGGPRWRP